MINWIENVQGSSVFFVDGKDFGLLEHLAFQVMQETQVRYRK
jgi:hypothetical protein